jgi:hypothetical protein
MVVQEQPYKQNAKMLSKKFCLSHLIMKEVVVTKIVHRVCSRDHSNQPHVILIMKLDNSNFFRNDELNILYKSIILKKVGLNEFDN